MRFRCHQSFGWLVAAFPSFCATAMGLSGLLASSNAHAAWPLITDNAGIADAKSCKIETWVQFKRNGNEYGVQPACNITGNLELMVSGALGKDDAGRTRTTEIVFQGKTLFKTLEPNGWAWGLAAGNVRRPIIHSSGKVIGDLYAYVPMSFSLRDDRVMIHGSLGWLREKEIGRHHHHMTWNIASETRLGKRTWLIAETFGRNQGTPFYQAGFRHWLVHDRVQINATYGNRFGSSTEERWFSIGLHLETPAFLP
ncbi:MAG: hypothetical protein LBE22_09440 [Azoarcus sp.]|nr:hypothetical protein [Azoarcus sp.]